MGLILEQRIHMMITVTRLNTLDHQEQNAAEK